MELRAQDIVELAAGLPFTMNFEPYRERLSPLAIAVLQGNSRRTIDSRRDLVLPDVWDGRLERETFDAIERLRGELGRRLRVLDAAAEDIQRPPRKSAMVRAVVDRVLADLLDDNDRNLAALDELEQQLAELSGEDRLTRAAVAARGAYVAARIPVNEVRAAMVRTARAVQGQHDAEETFERGLRMLAEALATDERRQAARDWVACLAEGGAAHVPLLADELKQLARESAMSPPGHDLIWIQACLGLTFEMGLAEN